jgi:hypothetical protein
MLKSRYSHGETSWLRSTNEKVRGKYASVGRTPPLSVRLSRFSRDAQTWAKNIALQPEKGEALG